MSVQRDFVEEFAKIAEDNQNLVTPLIWTGLVFLTFLLRYILIGFCLTVGYILATMIQ